MAAVLSLVRDTDAGAPPLAQLFAPYLAGAEVEWVYVAGLDRSERLVAFDGRCGAADSNVHLVPLLRRVLGHGAVASVVVAHNHVGGPASPSREDLSATRRAADLCRLAHARLSDHLIFADETQVSLRALGYIG